MTNKQHTTLSEYGLQYINPAANRPSDDLDNRRVLERSEDESVFLGRFSRLTQTQHRGFDLGPFGFVLEASTVYEIIESSNITPMPGTNALFKGLVNHRSTVVPVYDIGNLIDDSPKSKKIWERKRTLILGTGIDAVGIILYDLPVQIKSDHHVRPEDVQNIPEVFQRHMDNAYLHNGKMWLKLNYHDFFKELSNQTAGFNEHTPKT